MVAEASGVIVDVSPNFVSGGFFRKGDVLAHRPKKLFGDRKESLGGSCAG